MQEARASSALTFSYTVTSGQNTTDLAISSLNLTSGSIVDGAAMPPTCRSDQLQSPGTLQIDTTAPAVASVATSGAGITSGSGMLGVGKVVIFAVSMSEAVVVTGTPELTLNDGGTATYTGGSGSRP